MEKEASATEACQKLHKLLEACQGGRVRSEKETGGGAGVASQDAADASGIPSS